MRTLNTKLINMREILVVDDYATMASTYALEFTARKYIADFAESYQETLDMLKEHAYKMVLLDYTLDQPHTGEELIQPIFANNPDCFIIANSSDEYYNDILIKLGAKASGEKSFYTVLGIVQQYLGKRK